MSKSDIFFKQFEKLLQSLDTFSIELQLDVIERVEHKLKDYKNGIQCKINDNKCSELSITTTKSHLKSNENNKSIELNTNLDINSILTQSIRKSERISNRIQQKVSNKKCDTKSKPFTDKWSTKCDTGSIINHKQTLISTANEAQEAIGEKIIRSLDNCLTQSVTEVKDKNESHKHIVAKRKWRRALSINDLKCKYCGKIWRSLSHLEIHLRSHTGEKIYGCELCGQRFAQLAGLQVHLRRHNNERPFKCEVCDKEFYTKIDLSRHKSSHQEFKQLSHFCEICGKGFLDKRKLKNHIRFVHEKKDSVVCEICGHKTHGQHLLSAHKRVKHQEMTKHACPVCNAVIGSRSAFVIHLRAHADLKPCACDICGKQFRSTSQVARHKLAHKEGRHECEVCLKKFKTPHHLRRHQLIHSGEKPFECHLCEYKCNVNSNIVKHVKAVHGLINFSLATHHTRVLKPGEEDALQKGSIVTEAVLKDIAITRGQKITLEELKRIDEKKKREKELIIKEMNENMKQRKHLMKHKINNKCKKDILDDVIASTLNDSDTCSDTQTVGIALNETPINVSLNLHPVPELPQIIEPQVLIRGSGHIYQMPTEATNTPLKSTQSLPIGSDEHFKDIITLHFAQ